MLRILSTLFLAITGIYSQVEQNLQQSERFGGPHGKEFSDKPLIVAGQTVGSITLYGGERSHGISLEVTSPTVATFRHGFTEGTGNTLVLEAGERITSMEVHWGKAGRRTRIFYVKFITSAENEISKGSMTSNKKMVTAPKGYELGGFFGRAGGEIDALGAIWAPSLVVSTPPPSAPESPAPASDLGITIKNAVQLSESFGGPHGTEFSDKAKVGPGQIIESLTLYAGDRIDRLELKIMSPRAEMFNHGYTGGERLQVLRLGEGEHIISMEVHWGKQNGRTRVFYTSFSTNKGNTLASGSQTRDKHTVTAPEGFQLGGFFGRDGHALDRLGAIWSSIETVTPVPTEALEETAYHLPVDGDGRAPRKRAKISSESFGGPHGKQFSDLALARSGQIISSITIWSGERPHGIALDVTDPIPELFYHGGEGGKENKLILGAGEYITSIELHWAKVSGSTRIVHLTFNTSAGNLVSGGKRTDTGETIFAPEGYQLGGFFGREGDEIDLLGVVWTSIEAISEPPFTSNNALIEEEIVLSKVRGGPHGVAFSDIEQIVLGERIHSLTLRSGRRLDEVGIRLLKPSDLTLTHGGAGNPPLTLTLGPDEFINSMEVHWGKTNGRTSIFYASFNTNLGNSVSSGTKTNHFATETAPEGYELGGLFGRAESEIFQLGAIWIKIGAKHKMLTDVMGTAWHGSIIRNWVGPTIGADKDSACYRMYQPFNSKRMCPLGYSNDNNDCVAQCPLAYPVECGYECIPQNDDCALAVASKVASVAAVALNAATAGIFTSVKTLYKGAKRIYMCAANIINIIRQLIFYIRFVQTTAPQGEVEQLLAVSYQSNIVLTDLPIAIYACLGIPTPKKLQWASYVVLTVQTIVKQTIINGDEIISSANNVIDLLKNSNAINSSADSVTELDDFIAANSSCGFELKQLTDRVLLTVEEIRNSTSNADVNDIRVTISKSPLVLIDIPSVTNNCMKEMLVNKTKKAAFETRDLLRKTMEVIIQQLVETATTDMGKDVAEDQQILEAANFGLVVLGGLDPTGITHMVSQFVQPVCGPTGFIGEIDDGNLYDALGMWVIDEAFRGSHGAWTKKGDGVVRIILESTDTEDVTVEIQSGGDDYAEVDVAAGDTVVWESTVPELQDKTLYLDRWRTGLMGLPGTGGGSLLLWVPRAAEGGHLTLHARINVKRGYLTFVDVLILFMVLKESSRSLSLLLRHLQMCASCIWTSSYFIKL
ncbi:putative jacalin-like lectin domain-containing protein [Plasmopara halstedii]